MSPDSSLFVIPLLVLLTSVYDCQKWSSDMTNRWIEFHAFSFQEWFFGVYLQLQGGTFQVSESARCLVSLSENLKEFLRKIIWLGNQNSPNSSKAESLAYFKRDKTEPGSYTQDSKPEGYPIKNNLKKTNHTFIPCNFLVRTLHCFRNKNKTKFAPKHEKTVLKSSS